MWNDIIKSGTCGEETHCCCEDKARISELQDELDRLTKNFIEVSRELQDTRLDHDEVLIKSEEKDIVISLLLEEVLLHKKILSAVLS